MGVRGFNRPGDYNDRVLVMVNGHRINDDVTGGALIGSEFLLDVDAIDRVEVVRGPGSALYGDNAFFAVVNVITKTGADLKGAEASFSAGSFGAYRGRFSLGQTFTNGVDLFLTGTVLERDGHDSLFYREYVSATGNGVARHADGEESYSLFSRLSWNGLSFEGGWVDRTKHIPTGSFSTVFNDPRNRTVDGSYYGRLTFEHEFEEGFRLTASVSYDRYYYDGTYIYAAAAPPGTFTLLDTIRGRWLTEDAQVTKTWWDRLTLSGGVEFRQNLDQDQRTYQDQPFMVLLNDNRSSEAWGPYATASFRLLPRLLLEAGVRYDLGDFPGSAVSPRASIVFRPADSTSLKLLYGHAFRGPNDYERYYTDGYITQEPNPHLRPEEIDTYEAVWEQGIGEHWSTSLAGYLYRGNDLINQITDPATGLLIYENLDSVHGKGIEMEVSAHYPHGLRGRASLAIQDAENEDTHARLSNSPRALAQGSLIVPLWEEYLFSGLDARYVGGRIAPAGGSAPAYWVANVTLLTRRWASGLEVSATIDNLFDRHYYDPSPLELVQPILRQDGRTFWVKASYRF